MPRVTPPSDAFFQARMAIATHDDQIETGIGRDG